MSKRLFKTGLGAVLALAAGLALAADPAPKSEAAAPAKVAPAPAGQARVLAVDKIPFPKLGPIVPPQVIREQLPNGVKLLLVEDHELPQVSFRAMIRGGRLAEPAGKTGLSELYGEVLRTGGTAAMTGDQLDEALERIGASVESEVGVDATELSGHALTETLDNVLAAYADVLLHPVFAQDKIDLAKTQLKSGISRRNDDVQGIARREFGKLLFGANSPLARQVEYADVDKLTRDDLVAYHRRTVRPDETILAVWGDFKAPEMKARLAALLAGWRADGPAPKYDTPQLPAPAPSINYIEKKDVAQTFLLLGHQGLRYDHPDYAAVQMMEEILGGGFSSRLFVNVRTLKGLAYGAGGAMVPAYDYPGYFFFYTSTKPETTSEALATVLDEIGKIRTGGVTDAELKRAKDGFLNTYAFDFDSKAKIVNRLMTYDFHGYPADFNTRVRNAVEKVTKADVQRAAQQYLHPELLTIIAIGNKEKFDRPLATFTNWGAVKDIDITIPQPKVVESLPPATPESIARGKALLQKAAAAKGAALATVKDIVAEGSATIQSPAGALPATTVTSWILPDRQHNTITVMGQNLVQVVTPEQCYMMFGPNKQELPGADMRQELLFEYGGLVLAQMAQAGKLDVQALGQQPFEGQPAEVVLVKLGEKAVRVFLSPSTSEVIGVSRQGMTQSGPATIVSTYSKYAAVSGVQIPMESASTADGKPVASSKLTSVKINAGVDPKLFATK